MNENNYLYYHNNPIKPIINIGIILYKFLNNKLYLFLCQNIDGKYDLIFHDNKYFNNDNNELSIIDFIINRIYNATNYLILLNKNDLTKLFELYDKTTLTLIYFIKLPNSYTNLKSSDFNTYEIITDDIKIKRELKWIEMSYFINFILKNKKINLKLSNKDIVKNLKLIEKNNILNVTLNKIKQIIKK
jgi:hypothetical protein